MEADSKAVFHVAGFTFFANFDSGNLAHVRHDENKDAEQEEHAVDSGHLQSRPSTSTVQTRAVGSDVPDYRFSIWTRPDCHGTEFENGNRTWFYFGMKCSTPGSVIQFTVQNLNKQNKLFSQGMVPVFQVGTKTNWERLKDQPNYYVKDGAFYMSFKFRCLEEVDSVVYFAFTYPYTYKELQQSLGRLEKKHNNGGQDYSSLQKLPDTTIYFHRELVVNSLEGRRLDLVTISGLNSLLPERNTVPSGLFPDVWRQPRAHKFSDKKVVFLSARVHPGETCSSYVMLGLFKFLLNEKDPRAVALRRKYVFQLVPMLNPDGVFRGHYRTDTRGVNLNRVYTAPSPILHPTIFAARKLILLAHLDEDIIENVGESKKTPDPPELDNGEAYPPANDTFNDWYRPQSMWTSRRGRTSTSSRASNSSRTSSSQLPAISPAKAGSTKDLNLNWYEMTDTSRCSEGDESVADFSVPSFGPRPMMDEPSTFLPPDSSRRNSECRTSFAGAFKQQKQTSLTTPTKEICQKPEQLDTNSQSTEDVPLYKPKYGDSNVFLYVDIHGHASKRGIFMYGNHFHDLETKVSALLFPKLVSINSANFDFPACNFTQRNMYMKDRHTGAGREGSGRVSVYRATGLIYCYTLECNFNTGRHTNPVPLASRDCGRASPPPIYDHPPRYCPAIYEECGKYMAISILDLTESNPWTRLPCSPCNTLKGTRHWIKQYIKSSEAESAVKTAKSSKGSPIRTRLRSLSSGPRKSPVKQLKLPHVIEPVTPNLTKTPRKVIVSPRASIGGKLSRQNSRTKSAKSSPSVTETAPKKKRSNSAKKSNTTARSNSKSANSRAGSRGGSRAASPRCGKIEPKISKIGLQKKALSKSVWKSVEEAGIIGPSVVDASLTSIKKVKRKKKKIVNANSV